LCNDNSVWTNALENVIDKHVDGVPCRKDYEIFNAIIDGIEGRYDQNLNLVD
jgi:hypothetical protein